jgi:predicted ATPase
VHPDLARDFPPLTSVETYPTNLPQQLTTFVGRDEEISDVAQALDEVRIVTLTGVGGVGKTRLAVQTAAELLPKFPAGVWLCELGLLSDGAGIPDLVATTLSVPQRPGETLSDSIIAALRDRETLLVLDNCEHLIAGAARLVDAITRSCPRVRVLATSREGLALRGERLMLVRSLAVPDDDSRVDALIESEAVRLFVDRASEVRGGFEATAENAVAIAQICRRLDGIPLAIELAAARTRMMAPGEIARRLDERFRLLTGGSRTAVERHQTLRAAVDWSYALLDADEQALLDGLGVFAGGFTLEAAETVAVGTSELDVLDRLGQLVDKSLVVVEGDADGGTRYRLLETIRQYALERLDASGDGDVVRRRHAECYIAFAERVQAAIPGPVDDEWMRKADREMANFRAAFDWATSIGDADVALRLAVPLGEFGAPRPRYTIARWIERVVDLPEARHHPLRPHAAAWSAQGEVSVSGDVAAVAARVAVMDAAFEEAGLELTAVAHLAHSVLALISGYPDEAIEHGTRAVELALASGDRRWAAVYCALSAHALATLGHTDAAIERAEQAIALATEVGIRLAPAEAALGYALSGTDPERAIPHLAAAWELSKEQGNEAMLYVSGTSLAGLLAARGEVEQALERYAALLDDVAEKRNPMLLTLTCDSLGIALSNLGHTTASAIILGGIEGYVGVLQGTRRERHVAALEVARTASDGDAFESGVNRGREMTQDQLVAFARAEVAQILASVAEES